jgi:lipopolysaccharide transport protein LptA|tara:strand:+ start:309 stop:764 length:456 start_codon:yes stop_codon:yes gene_type:complete
MRLFIFIFISIFLINSYALSNENKVTYLEIESDKLIIKENPLLSEFIGNVYVKNEINQFWGNKIIVEYDDTKKIRFITIIGDVVIVRPNERITGNKAFYNLKLEKIKINGNVSVSKNDDILHGDELLVDLISSISIIKGNKNKRVSVKIAE